MHIGIVCKYELLRICSGHRRQNMWLPWWNELARWGRTPTNYRRFQ